MLHDMGELGSTALCLEDDRHGGVRKTRRTRTRQGQPCNAYRYCRILCYCFHHQLTYVGHKLGNQCITIGVI